MKIKDKFKEIVSYQGFNFVEWFGDMEYEDKVSELYSKRLEKSMLDSEILREFKPTELTLGEVFNYLKNIKDENMRMVFYCRDIKGMLRAVRVFWSGDGWLVNAFSVKHPSGWNDGHQMFSRERFDDNLTGLTESNITTIIIKPETILQTLISFESKFKRANQYEVMESDDILVIKKIT